MLHSITVIIIMSWAGQPPYAAQSHRVRGYAHVQGMLLLCKTLDQKPKQLFHFRQCNIRLWKYSHKSSKNSSWICLWLLLRTLANILSLTVSKGFFNMIVFVCVCVWLTWWQWGKFKPEVGVVTCPLWVWPSVAFIPFFYQISKCIINMSQRLNHLHCSTAAF